MSLILEALKKSEANRRLGQAPDLGTPFSPARRERSPLWALMVIVLALGVGAWWWFGGNHDSAPPVASPSSAESAKQAVAIQSPERSTLRTQPETARVDRPAPADQQQFWVAAQRTRDGQPPAQQNIKSEPAPHPAVEPHRAPAPIPPQAVASAPKPAEMHMPHSHPESAVPSTHLAPATPAVAAPPPLPRPDVPTYYDLPFATRKALPALSMSMHVYTADPKQRFIILDGTRLAEGDSTPDNVSLREIRPDGVILEFQGQRFFFPRDGH